MVRRLALAIFSAAILLTAPGARALPGLGDLGVDVIPDLPDLCDVAPELCDPPPPPPPEDPCDRFPRLCDPVIPPFDLCELAPQLCEEEPPVAEPPGPSFPNVVSLEGTARVKGDGFRTTETLSMTVSFDDATFLAVDGAGQTYGGHLVAKGGKRKLFLDDGSADVLASEVAARAVAARGLPGATVAGQNAKLTLRLHDDGSVSLKIKVEVLVSGVGEVVLKGNLSGVAER